MADYNSTHTGVQIDAGVDGGLINPLTAGTPSAGDYAPYYDGSTQKKMALGAAGGPAMLDGDAKLTPAAASSKIVAVTADKTLIASDAGTLQDVNSASAVTITIPSGVFPVGTEIEIYREGAGDVTIAGSGVTIQTAAVNPVITDQYTSACVKQIRTDVWILEGNIG